MHRTPEVYKPLVKKKKKDCVGHFLKSVLRGKEDDKAEVTGEW